MSPEHGAEVLCSIPKAQESCDVPFGENTCI